MRLVFFGTPQFAVPTLERLIESSHEIVAVITQPDKPAGRGHRLTAPPTKQCAEQNGIKVLQPTSVRKAEFVETLRALNPDVAVVVAYGKILPPEVLAIPKYGCLNLHGSLLPKYRGAAPIQWAIINGETETGVTIMQMDEGMDTGAMIAKREVPILEDDDTKSLGDMLSYVGADLMVEILAKLEAEGSLPSEPQNHNEATLAPLIKREMAAIDWANPPEKILFAIRGFQPWPKAFTRQGDREIKITGADACDPNWLPESAFDARVVPGTIVDVFKGRGFVVRTGGTKGAIIVTRLQPQGKPEMGGFDYFNGGGIDVGDRFDPPQGT